MRSYSPSEDDAPGSAGGGGDAAHDLFITETMAELSARQGRKADAASIYRRLLAGPAAADKRASWQARLAALTETEAVVPPETKTASSQVAGIVRGRAGSTLLTAPPRVPPTSSPPSSPSASASASPSAPSAPSPLPQSPLLRMPLLIQTPVRSGQVIYAEGRDLIVLAPVNPGAQLLADGHIHVYAPLRGRAVAGIRGAADAQIFCHRLEAELVGIDAAYVAADDLPADLVGRSVRIWLADGACRFTRM